MNSMEYAGQKCRETIFKKDKRKKKLKYIQNSNNFGKFKNLSQRERERD